MDDPDGLDVHLDGSVSDDRTDGPIYEYACHEGNFRSVQGMLLGARAVERR